MGICRIDPPGTVRAWGLFMRPAAAEVARTNKQSCSNGCGHPGDPRHECRCTPAQIQRCRARIRGPLLDRIDLQVEAPARATEELRQTQPGETSASIRPRIEAARAGSVVQLRIHRRGAGRHHPIVVKNYPIRGTTGGKRSHSIRILPCFQPVAPMHGMKGDA